MLTHSRYIEFRKVIYMSGRLGGVARERAGLEYKRKSSERLVLNSLAF